MKHQIQTRRNRKDEFDSKSVAILYQLPENCLSQKICCFIFHFNEIKLTLNHSTRFGRILFAICSGVSHHLILLINLVLQTFTLPLGAQIYAFIFCSFIRLSRLNLSSFVHGFPQNPSTTPRIYSFPTSDKLSSDIRSEYEHVTFILRLA